VRKSWDYAALIQESRTGITLITSEPTPGEVGGGLRGGVSVCQTKEIGLGAKIV